MNLTTPYKNVDQTTSVLLEPYQMSSDISINLKNNLKKKIEKKCNKYGYIDQVYKIIKKSEGIMKPENLSGNVIYNLVYQCKLCMPIENTIIIGQVYVINQELIFAKNGPIMIFLPKQHIDSTYWNILDDCIYKNNRQQVIDEKITPELENKQIILKIHDHVCVQIINKRVNENDNQIKVIGKLLDLATKEEVNTFFGTNNVTNESNFI